ncbi:hypothetical protein MLD52_21325 [Puniceicoccaceae bacterium K14]|nr:hypothetical protein [Puniceicoccaceae bacterium K14]
MKEKYGSAFEEGSVLEEALVKLRQKSFTDEERLKVDVAIERLSSVNSSRLDYEECRKLARVWTQAAKLSRSSDGPTDEYVDRLKKILELNPDDEVITKELAYQVARRKITEARLKAAARLREQIENGEGRYPGYPYIGGQGDFPESFKR